jgi:hypothetical protein
MTPHADSIYSDGHDGDLDLDSVEVVEVVLDPIAHRRSRAPTPRRERSERHRRRRTLTLASTFFAGVLSGVIVVRTALPVAPAASVSAASSGATANDHTAEASNTTNDRRRTDDVTTAPWSRPAAGRDGLIDIAGLAIAAFASDGGGRILADLAPTSDP